MRIPRQIRTTPQPVHGSRTSLVNYLIPSIAIPLLLSFPGAGGAEPSEPILPGGSSPRSDIVWYSSFDNLDRCVTGRERECWLDNGFAPGTFSETDGFRFRDDPPRAAVGRGYLSGYASPASSGPGFASFVLPRRESRINYRFYLRFGDTYLDYHLAPHGPSIYANNDSGGYRGVTIETSPTNFYLYTTGASSEQSFNLHPNRPNLPVLRNGRWYCIEIELRMDTSSVSNGIARMWIDGQLTMEHTNVNWGGYSTGIQWRGGNGPRHYYHANAPRFGHNIDFDNFVVATGGYIGPATTENPRVPGDPYSPYFALNGLEPMYDSDGDGRANRAASDCSEGGFNGVKMAYRMRNSADDPTIYRFDRSVALDQFPIACPEYPAVPDSSLKMTFQPGQLYGGLSWEVPHPWESGFNGEPVFDRIKQYTIHGWVYLPSSNDYSRNPGLCGIYDYSCGQNCDNAQVGRHLALAIDNNRWAIRFKENGHAPSVIATTTQKAVTFDRWHRFELTLNHGDDTCHLMVDEQWILRDHQLPSSPRWNHPKFCLGMIHHTANNPFSVYYDEISVGGVSFFGNDGWNPAKSPFNSQVESPEAEVRYGGMVITDGSTVTNAGTGTEFGSVNVGASVSRSFTLRNTGSGPLTVSGLTDDSAYFQAFDLDGSIPPGGQDTFTVRYQPTAAGSHFAMIRIANSDADEHPYEFRVHGSGVVPWPALALSPAFQSVGAAGGVFGFVINAAGVWSWASATPWITSFEATNQIGIQAFTFSVAPNDGAEREGEITISSGGSQVTHRVIQGGSIGPGGDGAVRPDLLIGRPRKSFRGDKIYNITGAGQTIGAAPRPGRAARFSVVVENDDRGSGEITIRGTGRNRRLRPRYFDLSGGMANITSQVTTIGWSRFFRAGEVSRLELRLRPTFRLRRRSASCEIRARSESAREEDVVHARVRRRGR